MKPEKIQSHRALGGSIYLEDDDARKQQTACHGIEIIKVTSAEDPKFVFFLLQTAMFRYGNEA
jgi:hypothetical protein